MSTSVLQPLNSRAVYSHHANLHNVAFASPETALHRRGLVLVSGFLFGFFLFTRSFSSESHVAFFSSHTITSACVFTPREHVFFHARSRTLVALFSFSFSRRTFPLARPPVPPQLCSVCGKVCGEGAPFLSESILRPLFLSSELAGSNGNSPVVWGIRLG